MLGIYHSTNPEEWTTLQSSPQKVLSCLKNIKWHSIILHSGLTLNHALSLGHGFSSIKVLPTPDKRAQQRNKGMAENDTKSLVSNISMNESNIFVNIPQQILRNEQACNVPPKKSWALPRRCNVKVVSCVRTAVSCTVDFPTIICLGLGGTLHRRPFLTPIPFLCYTQTNHSFLATTTQGNCKKNKQQKEEIFNPQGI